jgi:hypothetical protein
MRTRDGNEQCSAVRVPHSQTVLVRSCFQHGNVDACRLLDHRDEVTERLHAQMVIPAELLGAGTALDLSAR